MKVLFLENIKGVARMGDIKNVADGYARNFLIPRKMAKLANPNAVKESEALKLKLNKDQGERKEYALQLAEKLKNLELIIKEDANEEGHLYGSVSAKIVAEALHKVGYKIDADEVNLKTPIKTVGEHEVSLDIHPEVELKVKVRVESND